MGKSNRFSDIRVFILAAGLGTRLRPLTDTLPKVMMPVANGKPLLEHTICFLRDQGFGEFVVNTHYLPEKIIDYFGNGEKFGVSIFYSNETGMLAETGGALKKAENFLSDTFVLVCGDQLHFFDCNPLLDLFSNKNALATLVLKKSDYPQNGEVARIDTTTNKILEWHTRPHSISSLRDNLFLNGGIYVLSKKILEYIPEGIPMKLDGEVIPLLLKRGMEIYGLYCEEPILDIGTPEKYEYAKQWYREKIHERTNSGLDIIANT